MKQIATVSLLLSVFFNFFSATAQEKKVYVKYVDPIIERLDATNIGGSEIFVEYKSKKEITIYLELIKKGKLVGGTSKTVKSKKPEVIKLSLQKFTKDNLIASSDYILKLSCFEGGKNIFEKQIGDNIYIKKIKLYR